MQHDIATLLRHCLEYLPHCFNIAKLCCRESRRCDNRLADFLEKRHLIYNKQFGFHLHHSTDHAVLSITDQVQKAIEDHDYPCGIFLDFSKAFDTVNHNILLSKLEFYGIRGVVKDWFSSCLRNRTQTVSIDSVNSDIQTVFCEVLQGSVLGPLLFLIYIK